MRATEETCGTTCEMEVYFKYRQIIQQVNQGKNPTELNLEK